MQGGGGGTTECLQWASGEGIRQYLCCTDTQGEGQNGKLYCILCAVWLSSKATILKNHVLGKIKKQPDGHPGNDSVVFIFAGCWEMHSFVFGSGFCHFCSGWKIWVPPTYGLKHACRSMPQHSKFFLGTAGACLEPGTVAHPPTAYLLRPPAPCSGMVHRVPKL